MGVCDCSMFCCTLLYVHSSTAIILMGKRELIALLNLSSWSLVVVERLFLAVPRGCLQFLIVVFPDHTHLLFLTLSTITAAENSLKCKFFTDGHQFISKSLERKKKVKVSRPHCLLKEYAEDSYYAMFNNSYHCCRKIHFNVNC